MKYTMYKEENDVIDYEEYENVKEKIVDKYKNDGKEAIVRKVKFVENKYKPFQEEEMENKPVFSLCMKRDEEQKYYLEKKSKINGVIYKSFITLTKEEGIKILNRDIEWIKTSKRSLLKEFYLYFTINFLEPAIVMEYRRVVFEKPGKFYIVFNEEIKRAMDKSASLFDDNIQMFDCLSCDKIGMSYKKLIHIPVVLNPILNISDEKSVELAFSL